VSLKSWSRVVGRLLNRGSFVRLEYLDDDSAVTHALHCGRMRAGWKQGDTSLRWLA